MRNLKNIAHKRSYFFSAVKVESKGILTISLFLEFPKFFIYYVILVFLHCFAKNFD